MSRRKSLATAEEGYTTAEVAIARRTVGEDALAGIGCGRDYEVALKATRETLRAVRIARSASPAKLDELLARA